MNADDAFMLNQDRHWSRHASHYEEVFLDPFEAGVENPLWAALAAISDPGRKTVVDLGCGTGSLLPHLVERFGRVIALDFAPGMLKRARERLGPDRAAGVTFLERPMHELDDFKGRIDVAVSINSLVMPDVRLIHRTLQAVHGSLKRGGVFLGVVPSIDAIQYHTMLVLDRALEHGMDMKEAKTFTTHHAEHQFCDFAFGIFRYKGLHQKFWQPFEVDYRLARAGFSKVERQKLLYPWDEKVEADLELIAFPPSWDWFFRARP